MQQAPFNWSLLQNSQGFAHQPTDYNSNTQGNGLPLWQQTANGMQQFTQPPEVTQYGNSWQQVVPSAMPWGGVYSAPCTLPASAFQPNIPPVPSMGLTASRTRHLKRLRNNFEGERQRKRVRVNEERMSSGMEQMGLENRPGDKKQEDDNQSWCGDISAETADSFSDEDGNSDSDLPRLHLSEEVLRSIRSRHGPLAVSQRTKDLVGRMVLEELNKPCMQLVLWKPPPSLLTPEPDVSGDESQNDAASSDAMEASVSGAPTPASVNSFNTDIENTSFQLCGDSDDITDF